MVWSCHSAPQADGAVVVGMTTPEVVVADGVVEVVVVEELLVVVDDNTVVVVLGGIELIVENVVDDINVVSSPQPTSQYPTSGR